MELHSSGRVAWMASVRAGVLHRIDHTSLPFDLRIEVLILVSGSAAQQIHLLVSTISNARTSNVFSMEWNDGILNNTLSPRSYVFEK